MEEKIFFTNSSGVKLCGILTKASGKIYEDKSQPVIVIVHGFNSQKNTKSFTLLSEFLGDKKISSFRIDLYAHGESEGNFEELTITEAADDILQAINFLKKKGYSKIGLVGSSFGGNASIIAATKSRDLFVLALKSPVSNYEETARESLSDAQIDDWKRKGYTFMEDGDNKIKLNYSFFEDAQYNDGYKAAPLVNIPTLIVHGNADESVAIEQSIKTSGLIPNCRLRVIRGADHTYTNPEHKKIMSAAIADYIKKHC